MTDLRIRHIEVPGLRADGEPWRIRVHELVGRRPGPSTAVVAGIIGDKPLGALTAHALIRRLAASDLAGSVHVVPVANPYGFTGGTRHNPDMAELNRRFPGSADGLPTDQIAHHLVADLLARVDGLIDVHSGTAVRGTRFLYDYGDLDFTASNAWLPVMVDRGVPGQLCTVAAQQGAQAALIEFGGGEDADQTVGIECCVNMLRYRGHLDDAPTGPDTVPVLDQVQVHFASRAGALVSPFGARHAGRQVTERELGAVVDLVSGEVLERFVAAQPGEITGVGRGFDRWGPTVMREFAVRDHPVLMVAQNCPAMIQPGILAFMTGWVGRTVPTPRRG